MKEDILKIIKESWNNYYDDTDTQYTVPEIVDRVTAFIEWIGINYIYGHHGTWVHRYTDQRVRENWKTTEELYNYWKININT